MTSTCCSDRLLQCILSYTSHLNKLMETANVKEKGGKKVPAALLKKSYLLVDKVRSAACTYP